MMGLDKFIAILIMILLLCSCSQVKTNNTSNSTISTTKTSNITEDRIREESLKLNENEVFPFKFMFGWSPPNVSFLFQSDGKTLSCKFGSRSEDKNILTDNYLRDSKLLGKKTLTVKQKQKIAKSVVKLYNLGIKNVSANDCAVMNLAVNKNYRVYYWGTDETEKECGENLISILEKILDIDISKYKWD